ncbi:hypothetical protein RB595_005576 [Gaeumannomyces hyphopodioides]
MGVNGLWQVLQPCARPTNLATLNRKRLAVDASIWIYQFLKAVRDKDGNALRSSHVVGFFRRICKLLWFGIQPVFVFDGGAPVLKRATLQNRRRRREGRREDATRTANKLLAVQMQRLAEGEADRLRRKTAAIAAPAEDEDGVAEDEVMPAAENLVYADELLLSQAERQKRRKFHKQDAYHLPELDKSMHEMGVPNDPRVMSIDELENYARQFHRGEDVNLYDFSKIDFDGDFFKSLPPADRFNILNAARIRSRLRMGLSKEQLDRMFPDRRAFSRFQIERVQERNRLTQRLMIELGMGESADLTVGGRINSERDREYILVKNDGAEGGWALGVVSRQNEGVASNPIDVDAPSRFAVNPDDDDEEWEDEDDFEDVPIEGLNRLPTGKHAASHEDESMFVAQEDDMDDLFEEQVQEHLSLEADEEEDISRAIALSLKTQHGHGEAQQAADVSQGEAETTEAEQRPEWEQKAAEAPKPIPGFSGKAVARLVNNRSSRLVPRPRVTVAGGNDSDSDEDLQAAIAAARRKKRQQGGATKIADNEKPVASTSLKNPFGGPLPFEKLDWKASSSAKPSPAVAHGGIALTAEPAVEESAAHEPEDEDDFAGGFEESAAEPDRPLPLPPWLQDDQGDIRDSVRSQVEAHAEMSAQDRQYALEERLRFQREQRNKLVVIESSSEDEDDEVEIIEAPPPRATTASQQTTEAAPLGRPDGPGETLVEAQSELGSRKEPGPEPAPAAEPAATAPASSSPPPSPEVTFEDVNIAQALTNAAEPSAAPEPVDQDQDQEDEEAFEDVPILDLEDGIARDTLDAAPAGDAFAAGGDLDEFSDSDGEELLIQMAEEAEAHARFANTLNNNVPSASTAQDEVRDPLLYEKELRQLRAQQKRDLRDADEVSQVMVAECQQLLRLFGIPYITAPMEAEAQCAELVRLGLVDGIVTDDSDTFLFGGTRVYKNMFNGNKFVECYLSSDLEGDLSLGRPQLIALAQLLGSDYTEGLPGIGPVTAVEILSEFPGEDGLKQFAEWWHDAQSVTQLNPRDAEPERSTFRRKFRKSQGKRLFLPPGFPSPAVPEAYMRPEVDSDPQPFQWGAPDLRGLRTFLMSTVGWGEERTDEILVPVIRDMNKREAEGTQSNITRYFSGTVGAGARVAAPGPMTAVGGESVGDVGREAFAPRRQAARGGSKRMAVAVSRLKAQAGTSDNSSEPAAASEDGRERQGGVDAAERSGGTTKRKIGQKRKAHASAVSTGDDLEGMEGEAVALDVSDDDGDDEFVDTGSSRKATRGRKRGRRGGGA